MESGGSRLLAVAARLGVPHDNLQGIQGNEASRPYFTCHFCFHLPLSFSLATFIFTCDLNSQVATSIA